MEQMILGYLKTAWYSDLNKHGRVCQGKLFHKKINFNKNHQ